MFFKGIDVLHLKQLMVSIIELDESEAFNDYLYGHINADTLPYADDLKKFGDDSSLATMLAHVIEKHEANLLIDHLMKQADDLYDQLHGSNAAYRSCVEPDEPKENPNPLIRRLMARAVSSV